MIYFAFYIVILAWVWWGSRVGWLQAIQTSLAILIPLILILLFNVKAGRLLFRNPMVGIISMLPTTVLIFKASQPLVAGINTWMASKANGFDGMEDIVDAEVISKEDA